MSRISLIVGYDPLCGWCYGIIPALRALAQARPDIPQHILLGGLVSGDRVGPYAAMEGYIRAASETLRAVTGRAPSDAFFDLIRKPGVLGDSAPPSIVIAHVQKLAPHALPEFAHAVTEAHFEEGRDLNDPQTYADLFQRMGLALNVPDLTDAATRARNVWSEARALRIERFPTLILSVGGRLVPLPTVYDPVRLQHLIADHEELANQTDTTADRRGHLVR
jgi:putative protein-disulfide isomerase